VASGSRVGKHPRLASGDICGVAFLRIPNCWLRPGIRPRSRLPLVVSGHYRGFGSRDLPRGHATHRKWKPSSTCC